MLTRPIFVVSANGKTDSQVVARLQNKGIAVRRGSRDAGIPFDWDAPETWAPSLAGVSKA